MNCTEIEDVVSLDSPVLRPPMPRQMPFQPLRRWEQMHCAHAISMQWLSQRTWRYPPFFIFRIIATFKTSSHEQEKKNDVVDALAINPMPQTLNKNLVDVQPTAEAVKPIRLCILWFRLVLFITSSSWTGERTNERSLLGTKEWWNDGECGSKSMAHHKRKNENKMWNEPFTQNATLDAFNKHTRIVCVNKMRWGNWVSSNAMHNERYTIVVPLFLAQE